jgi:class 3 adenylate cyclase/TolB-like protein
MTDSEPLPRRLAAVVYADVAGYSRLTALDEDSTHRRLSSYLDTFAATVKKHGGKVMHFAGDAVLARFGTVVDAVSCASDVQGEFARRNAGLRPDQRVEFRIGVNVGDVIEDRGEVYGDGVNVAARLQALAGPGEICVADSVRNALGNRLPLEFEDLGEQNLKNIERPVRTYRLRFLDKVARRPDPASPLVRLSRIPGANFAVAAGVLLAAVLGFVGVNAYFDNDRPAAASDRAAVLPAADRSVAVLPFSDLSESGDQLWLADGITEEILNSLAQTEIKVTARTSTFQFRDQNRDIRDIAARLGVANVVEGSVRARGDELRVSAQLIRASDGFHLWSQVYEGTTAYLFEFQRDVAERVAEAFDVVLDDDRRARMFATGTQNVEAFREYQEGWRIYDAVHTVTTGQTLWDANTHFERAMTLDPSYVQAAIGSIDAFGHLLVEPRSPRVAKSPYSHEEALAELLRTLDFIAASDGRATLRLAAQIGRESLSPTWSSMPGLLAQLRRQWDVDAIVFDRGIDNAFFLPFVLLVAGEQNLVRDLAARHVSSDPLSQDAWTRRVLVEIQARRLPAAREYLLEARSHLGPSALEWLELAIAQFEGDRAKAIEILGRMPAMSMYLEAVKGNYATALSLADEVSARLADPPAIGWGILLPTYYETGEAERAKMLVKRIDDSLAGTMIFVGLLSQIGNALFFDLADAPRFVAKLNQARIDPASFPQLPRVSALQ